MSDLEKNKQLVREFFAAMSTVDVPALMKTMSEDIVFHVTGSGCLAGKFTLATLSGAAKYLAQACPAGVEFKILDLTAEDDRVACRAEGFGKMSGGGVYNNHYHFLLRIRDGKVHEYIEYMDTLLVERIFAPMVAADAAARG